MYKCDYCGYVFETPEERTGSDSDREYGYSGGRVVSYNREYEYEYEACPNCDCQNFTKGNFCKVCNKWEDYLEGDICDKCRERIMNKFYSLLEDNFTGEEIEAIRDILKEDWR